VVTDPALEHIFPGLRFSTYTVTSSKTPFYNCIAWAAGDSRRWWWPLHPAYWPQGAPRELTIDAFVAAYGTKGFVPCDSAECEPGFEKVAIYVDVAGVPQHAARQLPSGRWTSKLGKLQDIEHELAGVEGAGYGRVGKILKRKVP
jgi:hypothetical protein